MKKTVAMVLIVVMMLALGATAFAAGGMLTVDQAKQAALDYAGVKAADATFVKAHLDYEDGRRVYDVKFYANGTEYDLDVDAYTGTVTAFDMDYYGGFNQPAVNPQTPVVPQTPVAPQAGNYGYYDYDDMYDRYDYDDMFDRYDDYFDMYDFD